MREVEEETNLKISNVKNFYTSDNGEVEYFVSKQYEGSVTIDREHDDFAWVYPEEITNYDSAPLLQSIVDKAREFLNDA